MRKEEIKTVEQLAQYINEIEEWECDIEDIIIANGWDSLCGTTFGICRAGDTVVEFDDECIAVVVENA